MTAFVRSFVRSSVDFLRLFDFVRSSYGRKCAVAALSCINDGIVCGIRQTTEHVDIVGRWLKNGVN